MIRRSAGAGPLLEKGRSNATAMARRAGHGASRGRSSMSARSNVRRPAGIGGKPNLNGIWQAMNTATKPEGTPPRRSTNFGACDWRDPAGLEPGERGQDPIARNRAPRRTARAETDPEAACYLPGIPRPTTCHIRFRRPRRRYLVRLCAANANRAVHEGSRTLDQVPVDSDGWSNGHGYTPWSSDRERRRTWSIARAIPQQRDTNTSRCSIRIDSIRRDHRRSRDLHEA